MEVEPYEGDPEPWDECVRSQRGWTAFHLYGWRRVIEDVYGHRCHYLTARPSGGTIAGVLPLVRVESLLFGDYLVSMPFVNYGGPLGSDPAVRTLSSAASSLATDLGVDLLELRCRRELPIDLVPSHRKITVLLDLPDDAEVLWDRLDSKVRNQVRRPRKEGIRVQFGADQLGSFYRVFARHMRDLGTPVQPEELFRTCRSEFTDDMWFGCAYLEDTPIAAGCGFRWNEEFELTWAADLIEYRRMAPNMLVYWSFMERCIEAGVEVFNFGRCTPGSGTHRFKEQWGTRDQTLWWYQGGEGDREATPSPDEGTYAWGPRIWRKLPVSVTNRLGPKLVQYIP